MKNTSNTIIKLADDMTVVALITDNDEAVYREEVSDLAVWCRDNNLSLNFSKTKEMIDGTAGEGIESFKFLGVQITKELKWSTPPQSSPSGG